MSEGVESGWTPERRQIRRPDEPPTVRQLLAWVARGWTAADTATLPGDLNDADWQMFIQQIETHQLVGMLEAAIGEHGFPCTDPQLMEVADLARATAVRTMKLDAELLRIAEVLDRRGIDFRVLKGAAHAQLVYARPELRPYGDIDLLVRSRDFDRVLDELAELGGRRVNPEPVPGFTSRFDKGAEVYMPSGVSVDLHRRLAAPPAGLVVPERDLFEAPEPFELGGRTLLALGADERFIHGAVHLALGGGSDRLLRSADLVRLTMQPRLDVDRVWKLAEAWKHRQIVAEAVHLVEKRLEVQVRPDLRDYVAGYQPSRAERRLTYGIREGLNDRRRLFTVLRYQQGWRARAAFVRALLWPDVAYAARHGGSRARRLIRGAKLLLRGSRGHGQGR